MAARIFLIGMPGSGKSTLGSELANLLGWQWLDTDLEVERANGMEVAEIFASRGEAGFRYEEERVLGKAAATMEPIVISVGGGAVADPFSRRRMADSGTVVWLRAANETLLSRLNAKEVDARPLLVGNLEAAVGRLSTFRMPLYNALSDLTVDVDGLSEKEVLEVLLEQLEKFGITAKDKRDNWDA